MSLSVESFPKIFVPVKSLLHLYPQERKMSEFHDGRLCQKEDLFSRK